jgi:hypothetical protein
MNILTEDVLQAYDELGGIDYLMSQPKLLERILIRLVKQQAPQPEVIINLSVDLPWLDFNQRLAYRHSASPEALGATDVAHRALPAEESAPLLELATTLEPRKAVRDSAPPSVAAGNKHWKEASELERAINARNKLDEI